MTGALKKLRALCGWIIQRSEPQFTITGLRHFLEWRTAGEHFPGSRKENHRRRLQLAHRRGGVGGDARYFRYQQSSMTEEENE